MGMSTVKIGVVHLCGIGGGAGSGTAGVVPGCWTRWGPQRFRPGKSVCRAVQASAKSEWCDGSCSAGPAAGSLAARLDL